MRGYLLDTNIPSETLRPRPDANVAAWLKSQLKGSQFLSVVTMGELRKDATLLPLSDKRTQIEQFIAARIPSWFAGRILPVTRAIAERWGVLEGQRNLRPKLVGNFPRFYLWHLGHYLALILPTLQDLFKDKL